MRRTERLFAMAEYLRGRRTGTTVQEIADRFSVTPRTVHRDLEALRDGHLPITGERGRGGGVSLDRAYTLPPVNFSAREATVLIAGAQWIAQMRLLPFSRTLASAADKVRAALSHSEQRELITRLSGLRLAAVPQKRSSEAVRVAIEQAWFEDQPLRITYLDRNHAQTERTVELTELIVDRSETIVRARDLVLDEMRDFKLDRIVKARVMSQDA